MDLDKLTLGEIKELQKLVFGATTQKNISPNIGKYVIVRTFSAGVHTGVLESLDGKHAVLSQSRRIWSWSGAFTLSAIAERGFESARMSAVLPLIELTEAIELIPCSQKAQQKLQECAEYTP